MGPVLVSRPSVLEALDGFRHARIEASAGTGKTYTLEHLVVDLVLRDNVPLDQILVVTFTEKAASELKLRVRRKLTSMLEEKTSPTEDRVRDRAGAWRLDDEARARLARSLVAFDRATIATIHGFCQRILTEHAFDHGRPFQQRVVDGRLAFEQAFEDVLRRVLAKDAALRPWLRSWLEHASLERLLDLGFSCHARGARFTPAFDRARAERGLRELVKAPTHERVVRPLLARGGVRGERLRSSLGALGALMSHVADSEGLLPRFLRSLEDGPEEVVLQSLVRTVAEARERQPNLRHLSEALTELLDPLPSFESAMVQMLLPHVRTSMDGRKSTRGELDFSDMLELMSRSLHGPGAEELLHQLRTRYPIALIDEFQDTDGLQWDIFRRLYLDPGAHGRLVLIGDPKQAIYGFRGADVRTYLSACETLTERGGQTAVLDRNYRATAALVDALDELFDPDADFPFFPGEIRFTPVKAGREDDSTLLEGGRPGPAAVRMALAPADRPRNPAAVERELAEALADEAARLLDPSLTLWQRSDEAPRPLQADEIFVLTRSGREARMVAAMLSECGLPVTSWDQQDLFRSPEAQDVHAVLQAISDPSRGHGVRAWATPFFDVRAEALAACRELPPTHPLLTKLHTWRGLAERRDYAALFRAVLADSQVVDRALFEGRTRALTNYLHLFELLEAEAAAGHPPLDELVRRLGSYIRGAARPDGAATERVEAQRNAITVMTMHKAKGLEAEVVFLFGGLRDVPGTIHSVPTEAGPALYLGRVAPPAAALEAEDETRRLLYVALTRARTRVYLPDLRTDEVESLGGLYRILEPHFGRLDGLGAWPRRICEPPPPTAAEHSATTSSPSHDRAGTEGYSAPEARAFPVITSYSRIKAEQSAAMPPPRFAPDEDLSRTEERADGQVGQEVLPGGAATGRMLHDLLETAELETVRAMADAQAWVDHPEVTAAVDAAFTRHRRDPAYKRAAAEMVFKGLTTPLGLGSGQLEGGLAAAENVVREMEFLFPFPARPEAGFVKGFMDVVLQHQGRTYVLDWKSDELPSYAPEQLEAYVREHYLLQAEIYAVATTRILGVSSESEYEAFGGALYVFLRGLDGSGGGQWFYRPSWTRIIETSAALDAGVPR